MIGIRDYEAALALTEERHFGRAARRLKVSQPALTSRLRRLEETLGVRLFLRDRSGVEPTAEGRAFCEQGRRVLDAHVEAIDSVQAVVGGFGMVLRIGTTQIATHQGLVPALRTFRTAYPHAQVRLLEGTTWSLERDLEQGHLDVVFLHPPLHAPGLSLRVLTAANVVLADLSGTGREEVVRYPRSEAPVMMGALERAVAGAGTGAPKSRAEANTAITSLALSAAGYGAAFVTEALPDFGFGVAAARQSKTLFRLETAVAWRSLDRRPVTSAFLSGLDSPNDAIYDRNDGARDDDSADR
ncbi:MAG: LysR family transcriptional regulator [Pseudomonadota bacterium]